ncbi:MAG: alpha-L-fucosidase, partial [Bacteroidaceae bacterium]|nr:alpha-L-fucosidase [Bacteroidaceae bacterium]
MKKTLLAAAFGLSSLLGASAQAKYEPTEANLKSREEFRDMKLGIFLHWGIYSTFAQGEWYLQNAVPDRYEYAKAADAFYPHRFDARQWVRSFKEAGAKYICFTSRHHDGFSMWNTKQSKYNIVEATPFGRDVIKELAEACKEEGIRLHFYYSHLDWMRDDYPMGRTGTNVGKPRDKADWKSYYSFMNNQLTELLTQYGSIGAIWFDGWWDHEEDSVPFDWHLQEQYELIHRLQPACLVGNNHHGAPME